LTLYTIGFTKTSAKGFFDRLEAAGVKKVLDIRLWRDGQLSGFAKGPDLQFFLKRLIGVSYSAMPILAPTTEILTAYRAKSIDWETYANRYLSLLVERKASDIVALDSLVDSCLLCSEPTARYCHRRLAAEYLANSFVAGGLAVTHL
jgi:uncharacterized protein (DUF488 family)